MSNPRQLLQKKIEEAVKEFQARGGTIQKIPEGQKTDPAELKNQWGKPRKKKVEPK
jgi:hypothetical protein